MSKDIALIPVSDMQVMANSIARSKLFGLNSPDQALALMLVAQAEGLHPATAAQDYSIIQGRPAKKAEAMQRSFLQNGGKIKWHDLSDVKVSATFSHPAGGEVTIDWDMDRAKKAKLTGKDNWSKYPRAMLRARVVSEGIRTVCPMATSGMYVPEEVSQFNDKPTTSAPIEGEVIAEAPPEPKPLKELTPDNATWWSAAMDRIRESAAKVGGNADAEDKAINDAVKGLKEKCLLSDENEKLLIKDAKEV